MYDDQATKADDLILYELRLDRRTFNDLKGRGAAALRHRRHDQILSQERNRPG